MTTAYQASDRAPRRPPGALRLAGPLLLLSLLCHAPDARAQQLLDWPTRTGAAPGPLLDGSDAVFWNPASLRSAAGPWQLSAAALRGPEATGVRGVVVSAASLLAARWTLAAGYANLGIPDIPRTVESPEPVEAAPVVAASTDRLAAGLAFAATDALGLGAGVDFTRDHLAGRELTAVAASIGAAWAPALRFAPRAAAYATISDAGAGGGVAAQATRYVDERGLAFSAALGLELPAGAHRPAEQRLTFGARARTLADATVGVVTLSDEAGRHWLPVLAAGLRVGRWRIAALREWLPNDFGAAHAFRLSMEH